MDKLKSMTSVLVAVFSFIAAPFALAQDPVDVAPEHYKVLFENERVRVLETRYGPGESSDFHNHPDNLVIALSDGEAIPVNSDGSTTEYLFKFGDVIWREAVQHTGVNSSNEDMYLITIEFKD